MTGGATTASVTGVGLGSGAGPVTGGSTIGCVGASAGGATGSGAVRGSGANNGVATSVCCGFGLRRRLISLFQMEVSAGFTGSGAGCAFGLRRSVISFFQIEVSSCFAISAPRQPQARRELGVAVGRAGAAAEQSEQLVAVARALQGDLGRDRP